MNPLEAIATLCGVLNILLLVRRSIWNYPFGLVMVALYGAIFFEARLYSEALLQGFFFVVQVYGWINWSRAAESGPVPVERLSVRQRIGWAAGIGLATLAWSAAMGRFTNAAYPLWDGTIAVMSVAAQILLARRFVENWVLWILVDLLAIGLYRLKALDLTAGLYALFLAMAVWGLVEWWRARPRPVAA